MRIRLLSVLLTLFFTVATGVAYADDARIVNIITSEDNGVLTASADLDGVFNEEVLEAVQSGVPITFSFTVLLKRDRTALWDKSEKSVTIHKIVKYDSFAKEFNAIEIENGEIPESEDFEKELAKIKERNSNTLFNTGKVESEDVPSERYLVLKDLSALKAWMSTLRNVPIGPMADFPQDRKYYVQVMAEMSAPDFRGPLNYILFFVSFLEFETDWETSTAFVLNNSGTPVGSMFGKAGE